jgi:hypothetical protein
MTFITAPDLWQKFWCFTLIPHEDRFCFCPSGIYDLKFAEHEDYKHLLNLDNRIAVFINQFWQKGYHLYLVENHDGNRYYYFRIERKAYENHR